jgi:hypothetical protein
MPKRPGDDVGQVGPYGMGGERDVRVRAVAGVAAIERVLQTISVELKAVPRISRLRLYYDRRDNRFEWRWWEARWRSKRAGHRLQEEQLRGLRPSTKARVAGVQLLLDVRSAAVAVLRVAEWTLQHGPDWQEQTVTLRWAAGNMRRVVWSFLLSGGVPRRGNVQVFDGVESGHLDVVNKLNIGCEPHGWRGEMTEGVKHIVTAIQREDEELMRLQESLRGWLRLYYDGRRDSWIVRQMIGPKRSRYVSDEVCERLMENMIEGERRVLHQVKEAMQRRRRLKRVLHVLATLGEAAQKWPGGQWQLRGERGAGRSAAWVATAGSHGMSVIKEGMAEGQGKLG